MVRDLFLSPKIAHYRPVKEVDLFGLGPTELVLILVIVVILFGMGRFRRLGRELGAGIRNLREAVDNDDEDGEKDGTEE